MRTLTSAPQRSPVRVDAPALRRLRGLLRTEVVLLRRLHVLTAAVVVTALWVAIVLIVPANVGRAMVPFVLLTDVTALGFLFVPALLVVERMDGVESAMRLTPVRAAERVSVRVGTTTVLSLVVAMVILYAGDLPGIGVAMVGVTMASVLFGLLAFAAIGSSTNLMTLLVRAPFVAGPLLAQALILLVGLSASPLLHLSPATSAADMLRGRLSWAGLAWQVTWTGFLAVLVGRIARRPQTGDSGVTAAPRSTSPPPHPGFYTRWGAVRAFARTDRRTLLRDALLLMLVASVPLVALVSRLIGTVGIDWAARRYGVDLAPHVPLVWTVLLVFHTPVVFGALTGLLLLEDRDAGVLPAVATTRAAVGTLLTYRLAATAAVTTVCVLVGLPLAGAGHPAGATGLVAVAVSAGAVSTVPAQLMGTFATDRVQGVAVMKILGLPLYLPAASWFVPTGARWLFAPIPTSWTAWAAWAPTSVHAMAFSAGAVAVAAVATTLLTPRLLRRAAA